MMPEIKIQCFSICEPSQVYIIKDDLEEGDNLSVYQGKRYKVSIIVDIIVNFFYCFHFGTGISGSRSFTKLAMTACRQSKKQKR